jgi:hypothetical protein
MDGRRFGPYLAAFVGALLGGLAFTASVPLWVWGLAALAAAGSAVAFRYAPDLSGRRQTIGVAVAVALLVAAPSIVAAAHIAGTVQTQNDVPLSSPDNTTVVLQGANDVLLEDFTILTGTVDLRTEKGNITVFSTGNTEMWITGDNITGTFTNATNISTGGTTIEMNPEDKQEIDAGKNIDHVAWRDNTQADDGVVDFTYGSDASGVSQVRLTNVSANAELEAVDASTDQILDKATADNNGVVNFDDLDNSNHAVLLQTQDDNDAPVLSNPDPDGPQTQTISTWEVDVNDAEFPQGDSVTAELFVDGISRGTDTLSSNGTASVSHNVDLGKSVPYEWVATDSFGDTDTLSGSVTTPVNVTFREEHNASQVITGAGAAIILYSVDATTIVQRTDSNNDGNISLEGLPDKEFVAVTNASQHYTRRVYIDSIFTQQNIFLLNSTVVPGDQAVNTTFVFEDRTGQFPAENTTLRIQRALDINNDGTFEWLTIAGDFWGAAAEFPFTGEENARYRLIVENREGERRVLGTHIPTGSDSIKTVINGEIRWEAGDATGLFVDAAINRTDSEIEAFFTDPADSTSEVQVEVWQLGNRSNEITDQTFSSGPYGTIAMDPLVSLSGDQLDTTWVVQFTHTDQDGNTETERVTVGAPQINLPADPWLLAAFGLLGVTFVGTLYGPRTATLGAWSMVIVAGGMTVFGLANIPIVGIVAAMLIAGGGTLYQEAVP